MLSEQALRIAQRMTAGEIFYSRLSPRISPLIREELEREGLRLQSESPRHESTFFYPLNMNEFKNRLAKVSKP